MPMGLAVAPVSMASGCAGADGPRLRRYRWAWQPRKNHQSEKSIIRIKKSNKMTIRMKGKQMAIRIKGNKMAIMSEEILQ